MKLLAALTLCAIPFGIAYIIKRYFSPPLSLDAIGHRLMDAVKRDDLYQLRCCYEAGHIPEPEQLQYTFRRLQRLTVWGGTLSGVNVDSERRVFLRILCPGGTLHEVEVGQLMDDPENRLALGASRARFLDREDTLDPAGAWKTHPDCTQEITMPSPDWRLSLQPGDGGGH